MARRLKVKPERLWKIPPGTPFPSEMRINHNPRSGHASIKPANGVSPDMFVKVMPFCTMSFYPLSGKNPFWRSKE